MNSAYITQTGRWDFADPNASTETVAEWGAARLLAADVGGDGLYLATLDSGAYESVRFWREASERGLGLANPRAFPWTLSNSPTGHIAQRLGIRGPTYTLIGRADALAAAMDHAIRDIRSATAERTVIAALDGVGTESTCFAVAVLTARQSPTAVGRIRRLPRGGVPADSQVGSAAACLVRIVRRLRAHEPSRLSDDRWVFEIAPCAPQEPPARREH